MELDSKSVNPVAVGWYKRKKIISNYQFQNTLSSWRSCTCWISRKSQAIVAPPKSKYVSEAIAIHAGHLYHKIESCPKIIFVSLTFSFRASQDCSCCSRPSPTLQRTSIRCSSCPSLSGAAWSRAGSEHLSLPWVFLFYKRYTSPDRVIFLSALHIFRKVEGSKCCSRNDILIYGSYAVFVWKSACSFIIHTYIHNLLSSWLAARILGQIS